MKLGYYLILASLIAIFFQAGMAEEYIEDQAGLSKRNYVFIKEINTSDTTVYITTLVRPMTRNEFLTVFFDGLYITAYAACDKGLNLSLSDPEGIKCFDSTSGGYAVCRMQFDREPVVYEDITVGNDKIRIRYGYSHWDGIKAVIEP